MIQISSATIEFVGFIILIGGTVFSIFFYFQRPQTALTARVAKLEEKDKEQDKEIQVVKNENSKNDTIMQKEIKDLTDSVNKLNITMGKLETIIDERIPRGVPSVAKVV